jgi:hypothetical protein
LPSAHQTQTDTTDCPLEIALVSKRLFVVLPSWSPPTFFSISKHEHVSLDFTNGLE